MSSETLHLTARGSYGSEVAGAARDFGRSFAGSRIWRVLAMNDILARYRGSLIGPFWISITQGAFILGVGLLYSQLFKQPTHEYIPLLANGVILWTLISSTILDGCDFFIESGNIIKQTSLPLPSFLWRLVTRNLIIFAHQCIVLLVVAIWAGYLLRIQIWWAIPGLILSVANLSWMALLCGLVCTRFRDMKQVVTSVMQMLFFLTPVLWDPKQAGARANVLLAVNPFYHMLAVTRAPLLGRTPNFESFGVLIVLAIVGWAISFAIFAGVRRRVVHYL